MYTYLRPDTRTLPTRQSIYRRGSVALYHSLDIGRLVAFVGSGASAAYGRPSWSELAVILLRATAAAVEAFAQDARKAEEARQAVQDDEGDERTEGSFMPPDALAAEEVGLRDLLIEMRLILRCKTPKEAGTPLGELVEDLRTLRTQDLKGINITNLLALCEHVVDVIQRPKALRMAAHWAFRRHGQALARLTVEGLRPYSMEEANEELKEASLDGLKDTVREIVPVPKGKAGTKIRKYLAACAQRLHTNSAEKDAYFSLALCCIDPKTLPDTPEDDKTLGTMQLIDPLHEMRDTLGIKRFLTINFDSEIDEFLYQRMGYRELDGDDERALPHQMRDGFGGVAEVSDAGPGQLGRLVAFATLGNPRNVRVLHLHGSCKDPASLILTEADYQRRYLGQPGRRRVFHEALEALFTGNSVLFVGVGMNEADVLQPLRQFASVTSDHRRSSEPRFGRAFALLPFESAEKSSAQALELEQAYGVYTRFYGEPLLPALTGMVDAIEAALVNPPNGKAAIDAAFKTLTAALTAAKIIDANVALQSWNPTAPGDGDPYEDLRIALSVGADILTNSTDALAAIIDREVETARHITQLALSGSDEKSETGLALLRTYLSRWRSDIHSRSLRKALRDLEDARHKWSTEWRTTPVPRQAVFRNLTPHEPYDDPGWGEQRLGAPIWFRHTPDRTSTGREDELADIIASPLFKAVRKISCDKNGANGRRIRRAVMRRGAGKGTIVSGVLRELTEGSRDDEKRRVRSSLFGSDPASIVQYEGAFIAPGSFSTEFGTVAAAFYRFLRVAMLRSYGEEMMNHRRRKVTYTIREGTRDDTGSSGYEYLEEDDSEPMLGAAERLKLVREAMKILKDRTLGARKEDRDKRWLIMLVGVDRMCENGKPVSSAIRAFFEMLTEPDFEELPFDIMVISGDTRNPIEGLSVPRDEKPWREIVVDAPTPDEDPEEAMATLSAPEEDRRWREVRLPINDTFEARPWRGETDRRSALPRGMALVVGGNDTGPANFERDIDEIYPALADALGRSRILDLWVWTMLDDIQHAGPNRGEAVLFDRNEQRRLLQRLNDAALGSNESRVIDIVLSTRGRVERSETRAGRQWADLKEALLKYLALITTPVERQVLLDIRRIKARLDAVLTAVNDSKMPETLTAASEPVKWLAEKVKPDSDEMTFGDKIRQSRVRDRFRLWYRVALSQCLRELSRSGLVFEIMARNPLLSDPAADQRYTVHSVLREHLTNKAEIPLRDLAQRNLYDVSVHDVLPRDLPTLGAKAFDEITELVRSLTDLSAQDLSPWIRLIRARTQASAIQPEERDIFDTFDPESFHATGRRLKAVFSILHGVLSIGAVARLDQRPPVSGMQHEPFDVYRGIIRSLLNASSALSMVHKAAVQSANPKERNLFADPVASLDAAMKREKLEKTIKDMARIREPLHLSEIVWLINERGLVSFVQGRLYDARILFDMAESRVRPRMLDMSGKYDNVSGGGPNPTARRIQLNRALALLDAGKIDDARHSFTLLDDKSRESGHLARAYLGVCAHLEGRFDTAARRYEAAIEYFEAQNNLRAVSTFSRHWADLLRRDKKFDEAFKRVDRARVAAARQEHRDLMNMALISHARLLRADGGRNAVHQAARMLRQAESYAKSMGAYRIAADALRGLSDLMLGDGETEFAGRLAIEAMAISSINGMKLRKISSAMIYARVLVARGQPVYAEPILRQALDEAERCGYQLSASRAADELYDIETVLSATRTLEDRPPLR